MQSEKIEICVLLPEFAYFCGRFAYVLRGYFFSFMTIFSKNDKFDTISDAFWFAGKDFIIKLLKRCQDGGIVPFLDFVHVDSGKLLSQHRPRHHQAP